MIVDKVDRPVVIDLTGSQGNAFYLMGFAQKNARKFGLDKDVVLAEMKSGDYENLVQVFDNHFGEYVILER
jgi:hypothetical protein